MPSFKQHKDAHLKDHNNMFFWKLMQLVFFFGWFLPSSWSCGSSRASSAVVDGCRWWRRRGWKCAGLYGAVERRRRGGNHGGGARWGGWNSQLKSVIVLRPSHRLRSDSSGNFLSPVTVSCITAHRHRHREVTCGMSHWPSPEMTNLCFLSLEKNSK